VIKGDKSALSGSWKSVANAKYRLGLVHLNGECGFPKNLKLASTYFREANQYDMHPEAGKQFERLEDGILVAQIPNVEVEDLKFIEKIYFQYHLIDLCHGSKLINDKKINKSETR